MENASKGGPKHAIPGGQNHSYCEFVECSPYGKRGEDIKVKMMIPSGKAEMLDFGGRKKEEVRSTYGVAE